MLLRTMLIGALSLAFSAAALADTYRLLDHPDGNITGSDGPYGLRLDFLEPPDGAAPTLSTQDEVTIDNSLYTASVLLIWNQGDTTATITGTLVDGGEDGAAKSAWKVSYTLTGVTTSGNGFVATGGTGTLELLATNGTITDTRGTDTVVNVGNSIDIVGKQKDMDDPNSSAFDFLDDNHRLLKSTGGDKDYIDPNHIVFVGRGWIVGGGTNDWLVTAELVPLPASVWSGMGMLALLAGFTALRYRASRA